MNEAALVQHDVERPDTLGSLIDRPVFAVDVTTPVTDIRRIFVEERAPAVVVLSAHDKLFGIITRTDVLRADGADLRAYDVMSGFVVSLPDTASIWKAAALVAYEGVGQIVVVDRANTVIGVISAVDLLRHMTR